MPAGSKRGGHSGFANNLLSVLASPIIPIPDTKLSNTVVTASSSQVVSHERWIVALRGFPKQLRLDDRRDRRLPPRSHTNGPQNLDNRVRIFGGYRRKGFVSI